MEDDQSRYMAWKELEKAADARHCIGHVISCGSCDPADESRIQQCIETIESVLASPLVASSGIPTQDMAHAASLARHWLQLKQAGN